MTFSKAIGIIGGAGPMASAFLYTSILEVCQKEYGASDYNEFPEIILVSYPFTRGNGEKIREELSLCFSKLKGAGASLFCIASNSFHGFLPELPKSDFVSLVAEGIKKATQRSIAKALVFAAQATITLKLYEQSTIECLYPSPEDQHRINQLIREVASGKIEEAQAAVLKQIIDSMYSQSHFDGIIIACTELPLIHRRWSITDALPIVDTVQTLSEKLVALAKS